MSSTSSMSRRDILKVSIATVGIAVLQKSKECIGSMKQPRIPIYDRPKHAKQRFLKSMNCSQAVLETYAEEMGLSVENARKVASAFAGGMGMGAECGAVTGALMVIGMKHGKIADKDAAADKETFSRVAKLVEDFKKEHGDISCSNLLGTDMGTPEGVKKAGDQGLFTSQCPKFVETASEILERILS
jgi:C_GCAxxG_C_C family probable redox protein